MSKVPSLTPCLGYKHKIRHPCSIATTPPLPGFRPPDSGIAFTTHDPHAQRIANWFAHQGRKITTDVCAGAGLVCSSLYLEIMRQTIKSEGRDTVPPPPSASEARLSHIDQLAWIRVKYEPRSISTQIYATTAALEQALMQLEARDDSTKHGVRAHVMDFLRFVWANQGDFQDWALQWLFPIYTPPPAEGEEVVVPNFLKNMPSFAVLAKKMIPSIVYRFSDEARALSTEDADGPTNEILPDVDLLTSTPSQNLLSARLIIILLCGLRDVPVTTRDIKALTIVESILNTLDVCLTSLESKGGILFGIVAAFVVQPDSVHTLLDWTVSVAAPQMAPACLRILCSLYSLCRVLEIEGICQHMATLASAAFARITLVVRNLAWHQFTTVVMPLARFAAGLGPIEDKPGQELFEACLEAGQNYLSKMWGEVDKANAKMIKNRKLTYRSPQVACTQIRVLMHILQGVGPLYLKNSNQLRLLQDQIARIEESDVLPAAQFLKLGERHRFVDLPFEPTLKAIESSALIGNWGSRFGASPRGKRDMVHKLATSDRGVFKAVMGISDVELDALAREILQATRIHQESSRMKEKSNEDEDELADEFVDGIITDCYESIFRTIQSVPKIDPAYTKGTVPWIPIEDLTSAELEADLTSSLATGKSPKSEPKNNCVLC